MNIKDIAFDTKIFFNVNHFAEYVFHVEGDGNFTAIVNERTVDTNYSELQVYGSDISVLAQVKEIQEKNIKIDDFIQRKGTEYKIIDIKDNKDGTCHLIVEA